MTGYAGIDTHAIPIPSQDIRAECVLTLKPCVKFGPCMTHHSSVGITIGKFGPSSLGFFFPKKSVHKMQHKKVCLQLGRVLGAAED